MKLITSRHSDELNVFKNIVQKLCQVNANKMASELFSRI